MNFTDICNATDDAKNTMAMADRLAGRIANLLVGRLKKVSPTYCAQLKRELRDFNIATYEWKDN